MFKFLLYKFGQFCVHRLPLKLSYAITAFVSDMQCHFSPRDRRAVTNNLKVIFPSGSEEQITTLTLEVFRNFGRYLQEFFRMSKFLDREYIARNVKIENIEYLDGLLSEGKGGVLLTAHIGNWELGGVILSMLGYPIVAVALPHKERPVNDLFNHQRERWGVKIVQTNGAIRKCIEFLRENKIVALLADRDFGFSGEVMDFFGRKAMIPKGPAAFCQKTGAPIIPVFFTRTEDFTFRMVFEKPIYPPQSGDEHEVLLQLMKQYTTVIERKIREYPTQWLMFREFWVK